LRSVRGHLGPRCELFHYLIRCHRAALDYEQTSQACRTALSLCSQSVKSNSEAVRWQVYFLLRLAECQFDAGGATDTALSTLDELAALDALNPAETAVVRFGLTILYFQRSAFNDANDALGEMAKALEAVQDDEECETSLEVLIPSLHSYYFLMYAILAQALGQAATLLENCDYPLFSRLQDVVLQSASEEQSCWLPAPAMAALGHMIHATILRASGKSNAAAVQLGQAEEVLDGALAHFRVDWERGEEVIAANVLQNVQVFLSLRAVALEHRIMVALIATDLSTAATHLAALASALQRFPVALKSRQQSFGMILGQYAHMTGDNDVALTMFALVAAHGSVPLKHLAAASAALTELQRATDVDAANRAQRWLERHGLFTRDEMARVDVVDKTAAQLVQGLILRRRGDATGARMRLTKALKQAHGTIGSSQLVAQVLNSLAPVQQERQDLLGAAQMFESAITLSKNNLDVPSLITAMTGMHKLHRQQGKEDMAGKELGYLRRKENFLRGRLAEVRASREHRQVLAAATELSSAWNVPAA
jgi:tetratricopeptide (TPR) repeat protein